jgi:DNA-binding transcriptional LysR family regulator
MTDMIDGMELRQLIDRIHEEAGRESGSGSRRCVEQALSKTGLALADLRISMEVNSNDAIQAAVERGVGVSFLSRRAKRQEVLDKRFVAVEIVGFRALREMYLITDPRRLPTRAVRAFLELIGTVTADNAAQSGELTQVLMA